jgi:hypothetical protein
VTSGVASMALDSPAINKNNNNENDNNNDNENDDDDDDDGGDAEFSDDHVFPASPDASQVDEVC